MSGSDEMARLSKPSPRGSGRIRGVVDEVIPANSRGAGLDPLLQSDWTTLNTPASPSGAWLCRPYLWAIPLTASLPLISVLALAGSQHQNTEVNNEAIRDTITRNASIKC